jgi:hypothetical protein
VTGVRQRPRWPPGRTECSRGTRGWQAFGSHLLAAPGKFRYDDHSLAIYEQAGFTPADADRAAAIVLIFAIGNALGAAAKVSLDRRLSRGGRDPEQTIHTS